MHARDCRHDRKTEAGAGRRAARVQAREGREHAFPVAFRNPRSIVGDSDFTLGAYAYADIRTFATVRHRILKQISKRVREQVGIALDRQRRDVVDPERPADGFDIWPVGVCNAFDELGNIDRCKPRARGARFDLR